MGDLGSFELITEFFLAFPVKAEILFSTCRYLDLDHVDSVNMDRCNLSTSGRAPQVLGLVFGVSCGT
jgi:hypothetical protein